MLPLEGQFFTRFPHTGPHEGLTHTCPRRKMIPPTPNAKVVAFASSDSHDVMPIVGPDLFLNTSMRSCTSVKYDSSATNTIVIPAGSYTRNAHTQRISNYVNLRQDSCSNPKTLPHPYPYQHNNNTTRTDNCSSIPPSPSTHQPPPTLPGTARWGGSLLQNCANNNMLPLEVQVFTRFPHTGPHEVNTHLSSTKNDTSNAKRQSCGLRKFR